MSVGLIQFLKPWSNASAAESASCGRRLVVDLSDGEVLRAKSTRVLLALDEEWRARFGDDADSRARSLVVETAALFRNLDIHHLPVGIESWRSPDQVSSARLLLRSAKSAVPMQDADILIAITGQAQGRVDGFADADGQVLLRDHPQYPERNVYVLAHEIAHLFGANHACDLEGQDGLMAKSGYESPLVICPCTKKALEMNANLFHDRLGD